jgi:hypothetical protein
MPQVKMQNATQSNTCAGKIRRLMQVIRKFLGIVDRSLAARPVVINPCESLTVKVRWLMAQTTLFRFT